jgi:hypothetical protein
MFVGGTKESGGAKQRERLDWGRLVAMAKPNFSGVYTLKSSENEDAFLKAQGVGWVLRKAAKAVGSKRVLIGAQRRGRERCGAELS